MAEGYSAVSMLDKLERERRAARIRIARRGALDRRRGRGDLPRRARRARRPPGLPETLPGRRRRTRWSPWCAATRAPTARSPPRSSPAATGSTLRPALRELERAGELVRGELLPGRHGARVVRPRRPAPACGGRASPTCAQRPRRSTMRELARFLPQLAERRRPPAGRRRPRPPARGARPPPGRHADARGLGARRPAAAPRRLQPDLARRALHRRRARLDRRRRAGPKRRQGGPLLPRGRASRRPAARRTPSSSRRPGEAHDAIRERLAARRRASGSTSSTELELSAEELHSALWDLAWAGRRPTTPSPRCAPARLARRPRAGERRGRRFAARRAGRRRRPSRAAGR